MFEATPLPRKPWIERAIAAISPKWAAERAAWRMAGSAVNTYRGGIATRLSTPWGASTPFRGGTAEQRKSLETMRDRARKIDEDNSIGHGMLNRLVDNVVGDGFTLQARTNSEEFNAEVEDKFNDWWMNYADIRGMMHGDEIDRQLYRAHERDGDVGLLLTERSGKSRIQLIEGDQIRTPDKLVANPTLVDGVEMDQTGRPTGFHLLDSDEYGKRQFTRVDADNFIFYPRMNRGAVQVRGATAFAPIFGLLDQIDGYVDSVIVAARMAAIFGLIIKESSAAKQFGALGSVLNSKGQQQKGITLENGSAKYVGADDDVVQVDAKQPMQNTPDFIRAMLRLIGLPMDMPIELVLFDFSQVNYSSARASLLQFYRAMRRRQSRYKALVKCRIYRWWISREVKAGSFTSTVPENFWPHEWQSQAWQWVNPMEEASTALLEISMGINSPQNVCASLGRDFDTITELNRIAREAREAADLPNVLSSATRDVIQPQAQPTANQPTEEPTNEEE